MSGVRAGLVLERRTERPPLTTNRLLSARSVRWLAYCHRTVKEWRQWAAKHAADEDWPRVDGPVAVTYQALRKRGGRIDAGAPYLLGKAMLDGLVDADVLPDDNDQIVRAEHLPGHIVTGYYGVRLLLRPLSAADPVRSTADVRTPAGGLTLEGDPLVISTLIDPFFERTPTS